MNRQTKKVILGGFFIALGFILPFMTGQIPAIGSRLLPMHIPVFLGGFICGGPIGLMIGFIVPLLRSAIYSMPPMFPMAISMAFELGVYGLATGLVYKILPKNKMNVYITLIISMVLGRMAWGIVSALLYRSIGMDFSMDMFIMMGFINAIPGIIIQLVLIPIIVIALEKAGLIDHE
ncbi:MAG: ECF transporter S component [Peptostreptococcales bacterium]|jgi:thiamine transporter ThiT